MTKLDKTFCDHIELHTLCKFSFVARIKILFGFMPTVIAGAELVPAETRLFLKVKSRKNAVAFIPPGWLRWAIKPIKTTR